MKIKDKVVSKDNLGQLLEDHRKEKDCIVFTNGCFDILHAGHVQYLAAARELGTILIVGLNSDSSVKSIKGPKRPIFSQDDRAYLLAALTIVDYVSLFDEDTPFELIRDLRPNVLVKGMDYHNKEVVGRNIVESSGGRVELLPLLDGRGTSEIISRILQIHSGD